MFSRIRWARWGWLLASATLIAGPADARAAWLRFRNDLSHAVVIQSSWIAGGKTYCCKPHYLHPGESVSEWISDPKARQVSIADARPPRKQLLGIEIGLGKNDRSYSIQSVTPPGRKDAMVEARLLADTTREPAEEPQSKPRTGMTAKKSLK